MGVPTPRLCHRVAADPAVAAAIPAAESTAARPRASHLTPRRLRPATESPTKLATLPEDLCGAIPPQIGQNHPQRPEDPDHCIPGSSILVTPDTTCRMTSKPKDS